MRLMGWGFTPLFRASQLLSADRHLRPRARGAVDEGKLTSSVFDVVQSSWEADGWEFLLWTLQPVVDRALPMQGFGGRSPWLSAGYWAAAKLPPLELVTVEGEDVCAGRKRRELLVVLSLEAGGFDEKFWAV